MQKLRSFGGQLRLARITGLVLGTAALLATAVADAHFVLKVPANWAAQDSLGNPQKMGPCGNEAPQTPSNGVTPFQPGDVVTIQLDETIFHPGHYRIALAPTQNDLPLEPAVTPSAQDPCASAAVEPNPTLPILADNLLVHTAPFVGTQTIKVTLPTNPPCTNCVLQVLEFMSSHGAPCFYHHCANITIGPMSGDAGTDAASAGAAPPATDSGGCSCSTGRRGGALVTSIAPLAALSVMIASRRRARRRRAPRHP